MKLGTLSFVSILAVTAALPAVAQQQTLDPAVLAMKLEGAQFLLDTREKQVLQLAEALKAAEARAKWAVAKLWQLSEDQPAPTK